jgi:hypothetical protein
MRNSCDSWKAAWTAVVSARADSSECPNGFSTTMRDRGVFAPIDASDATIVGKLPGGTAR